ncbi:MAG TPA: polyprenyl diphosphate synthase [Thermoplasmata archaeon]|nr:polyprenyl diphosphate synthase [Thermoplasmata archaeon]
MPSPTPKPPSKSSPYLGQILGSAFRDAQEQRLLRIVRESPLPRHLAIIMDGNRRFAKTHGLLVEHGHERGRDKLEELLNWCLEIGLKIITVYALSTENLQRPADELEPLMQLFARSFNDIATDERVHRNQIRVRAFGNRSILPRDVVTAIEKAEAATAGYDRYHYNVAIAYGGREEIVFAIRALAQEVLEGRLRPQDITPEKVSSHLYTAKLPDPDLVFRTSGEERISNFLLWQSAYAELYFADVLWPGLTKLDFLRAIRDFQIRQRRYGG